MKNTLIISILFMFALTSCAQENKYPEQLQIRTYTIGEQVDTTLFKKYGDLYFPNHLDGWTMNNFDKLPKKYKGLPIAIWQLKSDSSIALTLLNDVILNITVSYMKEDEKEQLSKMLTEKFEVEGKERSYKEKHPLQTWITYWNLKTWETKDVIFEIGNSDMRKPEDPIPTDMLWNLVYSDFLLENQIIDDYKRK